LYNQCTNFRSNWENLGNHISDRPLFFSYFDNTKDANINMRDLAELARHDPLYAQAKKEAYNTDPGVLPRTTYFNFKLF